MNEEKIYVDPESLGFDRSAFISIKHGSHMSHNDFIMNLACLTALRSRDPSTQVGACIINQERRIVGLGFNDFPRRFDGDINKDFDLPLDRESADSALNTKNLYMCHAARHAILNKNSTNLRDCSLFATILPCNECFKLIAQSGIKKVYYLTDSKDNWTNEFKELIKGSKVMSAICGIELIEYTIMKPIDFGERLTIPINLVSSLKIPDELKNIGFNPKYQTKEQSAAFGEHQYYMSVAHLSGARSKDPNKQVGACIVDQNGKIISCGYNGFPNDAKDKFPWNNPNGMNVNSKHMYVCHAELNAIVNKYDVDVAGCTLYVTLHPCYNCAQIIIQSQIKKVFYYGIDGKKADKDEFKASKVLFAKYNIEFEKFENKMPSVDFMEKIVKKRENEKNITAI
jgi:dCMP deaminase